MKTKTRALIAEDEPLLAAEIREELQLLWPEIEFCATVHDGRAALAAAEAQHPDIVFLDVQMPGLDGLEVAQLLGASAHIVFITAHDQYAVQAFDAGAVDYLLKPLDTARLARAVRRLKGRIAQPPADLSRLLETARAAEPEPAAEPPLHWITVQIGRELRLITVDDICYFRADNKYVAVVTAEGEALISKPLKELAARLDPALFWQVHRSTIVNVNAVRSVTRGPAGKLDLHLKHRPERLEVSASYAHRFREM